MFNPIPFVYLLCLVLGLFSASLVKKARRKPTGRICRESYLALILTGLLIGGFLVLMMFLDFAEHTTLGARIYEWSFGLLSLLSGVILRLSISSIIHRGKLNKIIGGVTIVLPILTIILVLAWLVD